VAMLDLQRRVFDREPLVDRVLDREPGGVAIVLGADEDVGGQGWKSRRDLPDVEVVDLDYPGDGRHRAPDCVGIDPARGGLEEDPAGLDEQRPGSPEHDRGNDQRCDPVRLVVRPESIVIAPAGGADGSLQATVTARTFLGEKIEYLLRCAGETLQVVRYDAGPGAAMPEGSNVTVRFAADAVTVLPEVAAKGTSDA